MKKLVVIGGGINGAGIARDAAMRGWHVTLLEKNDFCSGTSWASSKLIHGGLRYLEHGEIGLVRESLREREILLRLHPYNIQPLHLLLAIYRHSPHRVLTLRFGMKMYEWLSCERTLPFHDFYTSEQLNDIEPGLDKRKLLGGIAYWDVQCVYPERLVMANLHSAVENGAAVHNYHEVVRFNLNAGRIRSVVAVDKIGGREKDFEADMVVNAAGPWIDTLLHSGPITRRRLIGGTRGSHIVIPRFEKGPAHAIYTNALLDGRPFFIIPWRHFYLVGTTDIRHENSPDDVAPNYAEIDYLIREFNNCFPSAELHRKDILMSFAGIRPLPYSTKKNPGAVTRKHIIVDHSRQDGIENLISLVGGKLTTYRHMAEQVMDRIEQKSFGKVTPCQTAKAFLWGGDMSGSEPDNSLITDVPVLRHLISLYGSNCRRVLEMNLPNGLERISPTDPDVNAQVVFSVRYEWAKKLSDVMLRRILSGQNAAAGLDSYEQVAEIMQKELGWNEEKKKEEMAEYKNFVARRLLSHQN